MYQVQQIRFKKCPTSWFASVTVKHRVITAIKCARQDADNRGSSRYPPGVEDIGFNMLQGPKLLLTDSDRAKLDSNPDTLFYRMPRMMQHADPEALTAISNLYLQVLPAGGTVLELCASCHSHLPQGLQLRGLVGQGMNEAELAANKALSSWFVQDLNEQPLLSELLDNSYDAVLCVNGVQYLTQPETVLAEAHRLLVPDGLLCVAFGSSCFPEKAIAAWLSRDMAQRAELVTSVLQANGFDNVTALISIHSIQQWLAWAAGEQLVTAAATAAETSKESELCVLLARKAPVSAANVPLGMMEPDRVAEWFTKPGLTGLRNAAVAAAEGAAADSSNPSGLPFPSLQPGDRVLEQWRASYEVLVADAVALGIPRSVIPSLSHAASPQEVQQAVQHLQNMVASFLSSGL